ncbi:SPRY domain-containing protein [Pleurostoma richardsiae]|uniref:SPRY domain-containing protein n=1 Tax=Pleurostoma richardsiae TaxID=41990 RepID=A0AA38RTI8_9PEZI|nr:SPRY domain-containing protein [Pleurostoma richardsiae]
MTNPFQHGPSGFIPEPSGLPGLGQRRSSYASVASGAIPAQHSLRSGAFSHLLNPVDPADIGHHYSTRSRDIDMTRNGSDQNGSGARFYQPRSQLPSFSRAFDMFMQRAAAESSTVPIPTITSGFFTPSYLRGSSYLQKLEEAHRAKLQAQKETQASTQTPAAGLSSSGSSLSLHGSKVAPPSHRGVTFDLIEKPPNFEEDSAVSPLPSRWNKDDKWGGLDVLSDGQEVKYTGIRTSSERDHEACSIRADHPMPPQCGIYYYEVTILSRKRDDTTIGIGFSSKNVALSRAPGWEPESWGYHGDDGHCFASQNVGKHYGPTFTTGDVIGCGINFRTGCAFFTKNGAYLGNAFREVKGELYPSVGLKKNGEHIRANFGQTPFVFDIDGMMKAETERIRNEINKSNTKNLAPPLDETELIQSLVLQFLQHDGYVETARAFAEEIQSQKKALSLDPNEDIEGVNITDDEDANNRQRIRRAILEGDIDRALKFTNAYYPQVLKDNEQVYFRLRCRKFIEMIRREAELTILDEKRSNGHFNGGAVEDMELDEDSAAWEEKMDADDQAELGDLTQETLAYGQALRAEFNDDPRREVSKALDEIFALMAYQNPLKEKEVSHLLDRKGRVAVAEELNSAILQSLGKSSRAALENVYAQTSVLLEDLRQDGGPGAFVTIQSVIDDIPKSQPF